MCNLHRRDFLLGMSGLALSACASDEYNSSKDYYPVSSGSILHWGKNSTIKIDTNASLTISGASTVTPSTAYLTAFKAGLDAWTDTLSSIGVTLEYTSTSPDVKVGWFLGSTVDSGVLGYASTNKQIVMTTTQSWTSDSDTHSDSLIEFVGIHEFGHMLGIWSHSFDINDIMYPYASGPTSLSNRDKKTLAEFLYAQTPAYDMHDISGSLTPEYTSYLTINGCKIQS